MAELAIEAGTLHIHLTVAERVLALHGRDVEVPVSEIVSVEPVIQVMTQLRGHRVPGTGIPGLLALGTWRGSEDGQKFHDLALIHRRGAGVVVSMNGGRYDRILLSTDDPDGTAALLGG